MQISKTMRLYLLLLFLWEVFHRNLGASQSAQSPGLFSVFGPILIMLSFGWSSYPIINLLVTVLCAPTTVNITVTFLLHIFLSSSKIQVLIFIFTFLQFNPVISWNVNVHYLADSLFYFFLWIFTRSGRLAEIRWSVCISFFTGLYSNLYEFVKTIAPLY